MNEQFIRNLKETWRIGAPLVSISTADALTCRDAFVSSLNGDCEKVAILGWDSMRGIYGVNDRGLAERKRLLRTADANATKPIENVLGLIGGVAKDTIVFMHNVQRYWEQPKVAQGLWNLRDTLKDAGAMMVALTTLGARLPGELKDDFLAFDEPLPSPDDLVTIIKNTYDDFRNAPDNQKLKMKDLTELELERAVDALIGLAAFPAEQSVAFCLSRAGLNLQALWDRKKRLIKQTRGLAVWRGGETYADIGGCENVKQFNHNLFTGKIPPRLILFLDEINHAVAGAGTDLSGVKSDLVGTLLTWMQDNEVDGEAYIGPPGCAKTAIANAMGNEFGIPTVRFDLAGMQSGIVGSSGENLRSGLKIAEAMGQKRILVIATMNEIDSLPMALRRRFKLGTFFFDLPSDSVKPAIWDIYTKKWKIDAAQVESVDDSIWTGAEIRECCQKAWRFNISLVESAKYIVPVAQSAAVEIKQLREQAAGKFIDAEEARTYTYQETAVASRRPKRVIRADLSQTGHA